MNVLNCIVFRNMGKAKLRACYYCKVILHRNVGLSNEAVFTRLTPCPFVF